MTQATNTEERDAKKTMSADRPSAHKKTIGAEKNYDTKRFVAEISRIGVTPHVAQNTARHGGAGIDSRTTRHEDCAKSNYVRLSIEMMFCWIKQWGLRQLLPRP
jgi:hypothetical protein